MIITLKNKDAEASIDSMGAQLISMKDSAGKEYMWQRDPNFWAKCSPVLFPSIGNCRDGITIFNDTKYSMPKHGFAAGMEFKADNQSDQSVSFTITQNEETLKVYPYEFEFTMTYTLEGTSLHIAYLVKNSGSSTMHYLLGAHPGFNCPLEEGESFSDYVLKFEEEEVTDGPVYDLDHLYFDDDNRNTLLNQSNVLSLRYDMFDNDAIFFDHLKSRSVSLLNPETGHGIELAFPDFRSVAFWTPIKKGAPFLCIEPWNGSSIYNDETDVFSEKRGVQSLEAEQSKSYSLSIRILN